MSYRNVLTSTHNMTEAVERTAKAIPTANGTETRSLLRVLFWILRDNFERIDDQEQSK